MAVVLRVPSDRMYAAGVPLPASDRQLPHAPQLRSMLSVPRQQPFELSFNSGPLCKGRAGGLCRRPSFTSGVTSDTGISILRRRLLMSAWRARCSSNVAIRSTSFDVWDGALASGRYPSAKQRARIHLQPMRNLVERTLDTAWPLFWPAPKPEGTAGWGARIRTWDGGTKTRCLTAWLRPNAWDVWSELTGVRSAGGTIVKGRAVCNFPETAAKSRHRRGKFPPAPRSLQ